MILSHDNPQVREERKKEVEEHVQNVTAILKEAARAGYIDEEDNMSDDDDDREGGRREGPTGEWDGFEDTPAATAGEPLDHEEEYVDEDRFTTVTVESVNVSRDGLVKPDDDDDDGQEDGQAGKEEQAGGSGSGDRRQSNSKKMTREPTNKKKKQKFRYESKTERLQEQRRQKARKKRKAAV